jgi:FkbM family methyltransferase
MNAVAKVGSFLWSVARRQGRESDRKQSVAQSLLAQHPGAELAVTLDLVLAHYRQTHPDPCFLQIGAFDGVSNDVLYPLVRKYGLRGFLVEPQKDAFARLKANYSDVPRLVFVNAALGSTDGTVPFYRIKPEAQGPPWLPQIASFDKDVIMKHTSQVPGLETLLQVENVPCMTFSSLYQKFGIDRIDLLQIDAEGYDAELLRLFDIPSRLPAIVRFEHKHLRLPDYENCVEALMSAGYSVTVGGSEDTLAYRNPAGSPMC